MQSWSSESRRVFLLRSEGIASWGERCIVRRLEGGEGWVQTGAKTDAERPFPANARIMNC